MSGPPFDRGVAGLSAAIARRWTWYIRAVKRNFTLITLFSCQALVAALCLFLYFVTVPAFAAAYQDYPARFPRHTMLALTAWYLPSLPIFTALCDLIALLLRKRSARNLAMGLGLVLPAVGLGLAIDGIFVPLFSSAPLP